MTLRELFIQWLTASRFIESLEARISEQRQLYTQWLAEKDAQIKQLRTEIAAMRQFVPSLMPSLPAVPIVPPVVPDFSGPDDWQAELNKIYHQEDANGISGEGRQEVHEPRTDDAA